MTASVRAPWATARRRVVVFHLQAHVGLLDQGLQDAAALPQLGARLFHRAHGAQQLNSISRRG